MTNQEIEDEVKAVLVNIEAASKTQLIEAVEVLMRRTLVAESRLKHGIDVPVELQELIDVVFDTEIQKHEFITAEYKRSLTTLYKLAGLRYSAAVSGAMRWQWSQEAALKLTTRLLFS